MGLPKGVQVWDIPSGRAFPAYPPLLQQTKPTSTPVQNQELQEVRQDVIEIRSWMKQLLSSREADRKLEVPDEATTLLKNELADVKEENGK